ncbi:MAG: MAC/perforin domain-containing protein [Sulfurospirillaceae bacterium]|nr:MAC/perforin domain-containing protein [Sulfurospirillaceae bacterium]
MNTSAMLSESTRAILLKSNFLGCGYDVTGLFCHPLSTRNSIIDFDAFLLKYPQSFNCLESGTNSDTKIIIAENAMEYCSNLTENLKIDGKYKAFSGALNAKFSYQSKCDAQYSFGSYFFIARQMMLSLIADKKKLQPFLSPAFLEDFETMDAKDLILSYGTHVITHCILGGRVEVLCRSIVEGASKELAIEVGVKASYEKFVNLSSETAYDQKLIQKNKELSVHIETIGGELGQCIQNVTLNYGSEPKDTQNNFTLWLKSLKPENITIVDMREGSLIPIVDLIPNTPQYAQKKKELTEAMDDYLRKNEFKVDLLKPLYRYYSASFDDHFYTTNANELHYGNANYMCEKVECMIYGTQVEGTVPLYGYYNALGDHFYTTNWNELQNGKGGYSYEGITGFVFDSNVSDKKLVPLYRCCFTTITKKKTKLNHFYTLDKSEFHNGNNCSDEGIACYVYKPTKEQAMIIKM